MTGSVPLTVYQCRHIRDEDAIVAALIAWGKAPNAEQVELCDQCWATCQYREIWHPITGWHENTSETAA